jgi:hypothetical protein
MAASLTTDSGRYVAKAGNSQKIADKKRSGPAPLGMAKCQRQQNPVDC